MKMPATDLLVNKLTKMTLERIFNTLGEKNIVSVILLGSVGRNQATYRYINDDLFLESDLDLVIVVNPAIFLKSLVLIKRTADKLTKELRKNGLLSNVSLSATTEQKILNAPPSIIAHDISNNGKVIFGKKLNLPAYAVDDIPTIDVCRLLFNRMIEALEGLVLNGIGDPLKEQDYNSALKSIEKLTFCMMQALLIKDYKLIFRGIPIPNLKTACEEASKNHDFLIKLLSNYEMIMDAKTRQNCSAIMMEKYWEEIISQFKTTLSIVAVVADQQLPVEEILSSHEGLNNRIKLSGLILLHYSGIRSIAKLFAAIYFIVKHGKDGIYLPLYRLFLSSTILTQSYKIKQEKSNSDKLKNKTIHARKIWLYSFHKYLSYWKFITGG